jgi:hypothetical protein
LRLIWRIHVINVTDTKARIEADIPLSVLDRLAIWGSNSEDLAKPATWRRSRRHWLMQSRRSTGPRMLQLNVVDVDGYIPKAEEGRLSTKKGVTSS